jgi:predicted PurR-regulated permease PerM
MGRSLNLSPLVILLALTFWAMIWGLAGAFLAIPLTVVILTVCSKVPALRPVAVLLSKDGHPDARQPEIDAIPGR